MTIYIVLKETLSFSYAATPYQKTQRSSINRGSRFLLLHLKRQNSKEKSGKYLLQMLLLLLLLLRMLLLLLRMLGMLLLRMLLLPLRFCLCTFV